RPIISILTTHFQFDNMKNEKEVLQYLRVIGLENADFHKIASEIKYANRRERIDIIGKYMDYRLIAVKDADVPRDAMNIARILGIPKEIIEATQLQNPG
ncbi:MAG: hypothetical protein ACRCUS_04235, partial [Anaerovoracaceae bacterium]